MLCADAKLSEPARGDFGETSIIKKQYRRWKVSVSTVKKSKAAITSRWLARKASQRLAGSLRRHKRRRYLATVRSETSKPSFRSSPWIFGAPQSEFSAAMRRMRVRISSLTFGRPPRGRDRQRQYRRKPARCHPITVSGFTMTRTSDHRGHMCHRVVQKKRSASGASGSALMRMSGNGPGGHGAAACAGAVLTKVMTIELTLF